MLKARLFSGRGCEKTQKVDSSSYIILITFPNAFLFCSFQASQCVTSTSSDSNTKYWLLKGKHESLTVKLVKLVIKVNSKVRLDVKRLHSKMGKRE